MIRLRVYTEPRDIWVGAYIAPEAVYTCPVPFLVFKFTKVPK